MRDLSTCSTSTICTEKKCCRKNEHSHNGSSNWVAKDLGVIKPRTSIHEEVNSSALRVEDVEEGLSRSEHVTLRFQGSNCPACISKISSALDKMQHIHHAQINAVLMQIDFDIDLSKSSTSDAIKSVQELIKRPCRRIGDGFQQLEVMIPSSDGRSADVALPRGVKDMTRMKTDTFRVRYDASVIGARQLLKALDKNPEMPATLLPPVPESEIPSDIRMSAYRTFFSFALTCPILVLSWAPLPSHPITYGAVSLALASVIQIAIAAPFCLKALRSLVRSRQIDMDILILLSTTLAYVFSIASFVCEVKHKTWSSGLYFETSALLISFIMVGRLMSDFACYRSLKSIPINSLQPQTALLVGQSNALDEAVSEIDACLLQFGDVFMVKRNCLVVTDGKIVSGQAEFDEGVVTGEASLVKRVIGATVIAGSINRGSDVLVQVTRLPGQNTIDEIAGLV